MSVTVDESRINYYLHHRIRCIQRNITEEESFHCMISHEDAQLLAEAIEHTTALQVLKLEFSDISETGFIALASALERNESIEELELQWTTRGETSEAAGTTMAHALMSKGNFTKLNISGNFCFENVFIALAEAVGSNTNLQEFRLQVSPDYEYDTAKGLEKLMAGLQACISLKSLHITGLQLRDNDVLNLAEVLTTNKSLSVLNLKNCTLSAKSLLVIAEALAISPLAELVLDNEVLSDQFVIALSTVLRTNTTLQILRLSSKSISEVAAIALASSLKHNTTLLNIYISDEGAAAFGDMLQVNSSLTKLELCAKKFMKKSSLRFAKALATNDTLKSLKLFLQRINTKGFSTFISNLGSNSGLRRLFLMSINDPITDESLTCLSTALRDNSNLAELHLANTRMTENGYIALVTGLGHNSGVKELHLPKAPSMTCHASLGEMLKVNSTIEFLDLEGQDIGDEAVSMFAPGLKQNQTLKRLQLGGNAIEGVGGKELAQALKNHPSLEELYVFYSHLQDEGIVALAEILGRHNRALKKLDIVGTYFTDVGAMAIADALKDDKTLEILEMQFNLITDVGAQAVIKSLEFNTCLEKLILENFDGDLSKEVDDLAEEFRTPSRIISID